MNRPSDTADVRLGNLALVLQTLDQLAPCSRTDLRSATGLVSGTVSSIVDELVGRGVVIETGETTTAGRGRPRRVLSLNPGRVVSVAIQLSPEEITGEIRDLSGEPLWTRRERHTIRPGRGEDVVAEVARVIDATLTAAADLPDAWVCGIAVAVPAPVVEGRDIAHAIDFGLGRTPLAEPLREHLDGTRDVVIMNDARLGALAEYAALPIENRPKAMVYLWGGAGVGGGIVVDGAPYLGAHLMAGECGHISVDLDGPECACGGRGCLTLYLGTDGLLATAGIDDSTADDGGLAELLRRLEDGDPAAIGAIERAGAALASAIGTMANYTDVDLVVLGGTLPTLAPWLLPPVERLIRSRASRIAEFNPAIRLAYYGDTAVRIGAWKLAREGALANPVDIPFLPEQPSSPGANASAGAR